MRSVGKLSFSSSPNSVSRPFCHMCAVFGSHGSLKRYVAKVLFPVKYCWETVEALVGAGGRSLVIGDKPLKGTTGFQLIVVHSRYREVDIAITWGQIWPSPLAPAPFQRHSFLYLLLWLHNQVPTNSATTVPFIQRQPLESPRVLLWREYSGSHDVQVLKLSLELPWTTLTLGIDTALPWDFRVSP